MCKVSVLIPAYNVENYLRECLESVLNQTLSDIEVICINDGSTDRTLDILREYAIRDDRIRLINQMNGGYGRAINVGLQAAVGEYIGIVEPDDYIETDMYRILWETAKKHALDVVKSDYAYFKGTGSQRIFDRIMICPQLSWYFRKWVPSDVPKLLDVDMMNVTGIYRRAFLEEYDVKLRETSGAAFQDTGLWFQIFLQAGSAMFLPRAFYKIRRDNPDSSVLNTGKFYRICEEYEGCFQKLRDYPHQYVKFAPYLFRRTVFAYLFILSKMDDCEQTKVFARFSEEINTARRRGEYDEHFFTDSMNRFLCAVSVWTQGSDLPAYGKSSCFIKRLYECVWEHGWLYLLRRVLIRFHLQNEVF